MKCIATVLMLLALCSSMSLADPKAEDHSGLKGKDLIRFLKNNVEVEIRELQQGHSISLRAPNNDRSERLFYSIQLFLIKFTESKESEIDVLEVTSGRNGEDINFLMNISSEKAQSSYVVFREERRDHPEKESKWVETTIRLEDLLEVDLTKIEPAPGKPAIRSMSK